MTGPDARPRIAAKRILVVDDTSHVAEVIHAMLDHFGHQVETAGSGAEALNLFQPGKYDLIITDYAMPGMTGLDLARAIKQRAAGQLVMLTTGSAFAVATQTADRAQVDLILVKPFTTREFESGLAELFGPPTP